MSFHLSYYLHFPSFTIKSSNGRPKITVTHTLHSQVWTSSIRYTSDIWHIFKTRNGSSIFHLNLYYTNSLDSGHIRLTIIISETFKASAFPHPSLPKSHFHTQTHSAHSQGLKVFPIKTYVACEELTAHKLSSSGIWSQEFFLREGRGLGKCWTFNLAFLLEKLQFFTYPHFGEASAPLAPST